MGVVLLLYFLFIQYPVTFFPFSLCNLSLVLPLSRNFVIYTFSFLPFTSFPLFVILIFLHNSSFLDCLHFISFPASILSISSFILPPRSISSPSRLYHLFFLFLLHISPLFFLSFSFILLSLTTIVLAFLHRLLYSP